MKPTIPVPSANLPNAPSNVQKHSGVFSCTAGSVDILARSTISLEGVANFTVFLKESIYNGHSTDISYVWSLITSFVEFEHLE